MMNTLQDIYREGYASNILDALRQIREMRNYTAPGILRSCLELALTHVRYALGWANRLKDGRLRRLCLRLLGWIAADLRRMPE